MLIKGLLAFAESNLPEEHFATIMIRQGSLDRCRLPEIVSLMKNGRSSEEAILDLVETIPASNRSDLEQGRREQALCIMASLLVWPDYDIRFYAGDDLVRCRLFLGLSIPELLAESARHAVSREYVRVPGRFAQRHCSVITERAETVPLLPLNTTEASLYALLKKPRSAAEVLSLMAHEDAKKTEASLLCLSLLGLVRIEEPPEHAGYSIGTDHSPLSALGLDAILARIEQSDLYEVLGVRKEATQDEIQSAYHALAKRYHPDRFQSKDYPAEVHTAAQRVFTGINSAYLTLRDTQSRAAYETSLAANDTRVDPGGKKPAEDEKTAEALFNNGKKLIAEKVFEKAAESLKGCVWLYPERASYHHYLGVALSELPNRRKLAEEHLLKALELDFTSIGSRLALARLYSTVMLRNKAQLQLEEVLRWDPENREALKLLKKLSGSSK